MFVPNLDLGTALMAWEVGADAFDGEHCFLIAPTENSELILKHARLALFKNLEICRIPSALSLMSVKQVTRVVGVLR
jgi:hypothetical protein